MRYYNKEGEWFLDRREFLRKSKRINLSYDTKRREDRMKIACGQDMTISDIFLILGIKFVVKGIDSLYVQANYNDQPKNYEKIVDYVNETKREFFLIAFEDDSLVVYENDIIRLYQSEEDLDKAIRVIDNKIKEMGSDVKLKKYMFKMQNDIAINSTSQSTDAQLN